MENASTCITMITVNGQLCRLHVTSVALTINFWIFENFCAVLDGGQMTFVSFYDKSNTA